jgi:hypothetical protein
MEFDNLCVAFGLGSSNDMSNAPCGQSAGAACVATACQLLRLRRDDPARGRRLIAWLL